MRKFPNDLWSGELEDYTLLSILIAGAGDAESAYLGGVGYMGSGAEAFVVVADAYDADCVRSSFR